MNMEYLSNYLPPISFTNVLEFSVKRSFTSLVKFMPKYLLYFWSCCKWECILNISFQWLVSRSATDFCALLNYWICLLVLTDCLVESSEFPIYKIVSRGNRQFTSCFLTQVPCIYCYWQSLWLGLQALL